MSKYARDEFERRFLVGVMPPAESVEEITDRYILGTRLRLRVNSTPERTIYKLAKIEDISLGHKRLTNLYLGKSEFLLLVSLPARVLRKRRQVLSHDGRTWIVDEFSNGLMIAEVEFSVDDDVVVPSWCGREITGDPSFSGWAMAE